MEVGDTHAYKNKFMKKIKFIIFLLSCNMFSQIENDLEGSFCPETGKYIVSGWVKEDRTDQPITYTSKIKVQITGINSEIVEYNPDMPPNLILSVSFLPSGKIIDGWQRTIGIIEIPPLDAIYFNAFFIIELQCENPNSNDCYFDDIRFYPYNGNMKSFVYDEDTQRLMAELDENNYATFYEYDLEGGLVRIKKETEKGVFTIQETRSNNTKK